MQRYRLRERGARLQAAQRGGGSQCLRPAHGGLHQQVRAQRVVVVEVLVAAAQAVRDAPGVAWITKRCRGCSTQADALVHTAQQQHPAVRADVATPEVGLDDAPPKASKLNRPMSTLWHRESRLFIDVKRQ